jgi:predicted heme/steroid binding protein
MSDKRFTPEELSKYDGSGEGGEIYVAIRGTIYDVTSKKDMYGPGGNYRVFAGKDASKVESPSFLMVYKRFCN